MAKLVKRKVVEETYEVPVEDDELDEVDDSANDDDEVDDDTEVEVEEKLARGAKKAGRARSR